MGITDFFTDVWETFANPAADADQPPVQGGSSTQSPASGTDEESSEEAEVNKQDAAKGECAESKECHGPKHHYDECAQRVTGQIENDGKAKEDCVEEFFHLAHCASQCAAPKLFAQLK
ncbi:ubiquinol-cytochrome c reductase complex protein [Pyrenophora tritici-repentis]|uniref:Ubiquinol-cytochrome c reductase complex 17 kd protein n=1 Tax=Pyrenophora tritici-repentis TaxID=45151 RepID=A0A2W1EU48_9PLEO|nr:ubiquinol-cytochrome c reductase complex subunit [Pyrenophora tritici-repentis]KAF7454595.1 ubiquinol-cytochrome c reductase complex protein [Pyrenophora tritici-repentis]KAF7577718.1 ubiquinol-cytochrome c reductase complex 17 kd protein [Pyrenophora tritici-repentis]KAG9388349.1 ubiquinol-cytochrome c reductase complex protein [Pyrenophora tritici-repentis]KAI0571131.1 ubiquinol-cytochrome c reductase complex subunit [Pyrenophora tritici-repentis]